MLDAVATAGGLERAVFRKFTFRLFPFMILLRMVNFLDRVTIGYAALTINCDLGISPSVFGLAAGVFFIGYVLCEIPSDILLHKVASDRWLCRIMVTSGLVFAGMAFVRGPVGRCQLNAFRNESLQSSHTGGRTRQPIDAQGGLRKLARLRRTATLKLKLTMPFQIMNASKNAAISA